MIDDTDDIVSCPYNPAHRVAQSRMQFHLAKCFYVAPVPLQVCRFNSAHQYPTVSIEAHERECRDRRIVERDIVQRPSQASVVMAYQAPDLPHPPDESWEDDDAQTYDPSIKTLNAPVLRSLQGATKSERKHHRQMERERMQHLADGDRNIPNLPPAHGDQACARPPKEAFDYNKPLRAPTSKSKTYQLPDLVPAIGIGLGRGRIPAQDRETVGLGRGAVPKQNGHQHGSPPLSAGAGSSSDWPHVEFPHLQQENPSRGRGRSPRE